ncbi:MAG: ABC transporter permease, partial [Propionibacteriaceae bacterium]|nr:ABC transporter permease [Propionibacteriaceae bacterium]
MSDQRIDQAKPSWRVTFQRITSTTTVIVILAIVVALVVGAILIAATNADVQRTATYLFARPSDFFAALGESIGGSYAALFRGAVVNFGAATIGDVFSPLAGSISLSVPLIFAGLALGMGFRAGLFNIGGQGQIIIGAVLCAYIGFTWHLPDGLHVLACIVGAIVGGAIWGFIPGILKATTGANE